MHKTDTMLQFIGRTLAKRSFSFLIFLKNALVLLIVLSVTVTLYQYIYYLTFRWDQLVIGITAFWLFTAYKTIPRIHRWLTKIYLPDYYMGRTRTGDGILGDPVNLAFIGGTTRQIKRVMREANWLEADLLNRRSAFKMFVSSLRRRAYPTAPVSSLYLFGNKQNLAFEQAVGATTTKRHHVRFWRCPKNWYLPGGQKATWLAAATFDKSVGLSLFNLQVTHKIESNIDIERDFVVASLRKSSLVASIEVKKNFTTAYHHRNGGGDLIKTDGSMPFITIA